MFVNNITAYDYKSDGNSLDLVLGCTVDEALAMDLSVIEVRTDAGDLAEAFAGYVKKSATVDAATGRVTLSCYLDTTGAGAACDALAKENADLKLQIEEQAGAIEELANIIAGMEG